MKLALAFLFLTINAHGLVVTNGVFANTNAPADPFSGWQFNASQCTAIGARVFCSVRHISLGSTIVYRGVTNRIIKTVDVPNQDLCFLISEFQLPAWSGVATNGWTEGMTPEFPIWIVANGVGCKSLNGEDCMTDGKTWYWGSNPMKRWGKGIAVCTRGKLWWRLGTALASSGDSGNSTFNERGEFLAPISAGNNPATLESWSGGVLARPFIHLVEEYMWPATTNRIPRPSKARNVSVAHND